VFDVIPNLLEIIQPNLRPVNTQLYSPKEKEELKELVATMLSYNLTYAQERTNEGQYNYKYVNSLCL
jgi:chromosome transmission fidelity protein 18